MATHSSDHTHITLSTTAVVTPTCRSYKAYKNDFIFEKTLTSHLPGIIAEFSKSKPTLVFCR